MQPDALVYRPPGRGYDLASLKCLAWQQECTHMTGSAGYLMYYLMFHYNISKRPNSFVLGVSSRARDELAPKTGPGGLFSLFLRSCNTAIPDMDMLHYLYQQQPTSLFAYLCAVLVG